jgi:lipoic acid synthetase
VSSGVPDPVEADEPARVALQIREMGLSHAVITSVTRDDLIDGGASHFAETIRAIRRLNPETTIEVLTPDFNCNVWDIETVCAAMPNIFNHNLETVERLTPYIRSRAQYHRSLEVLRIAKKALPSGLIKSGLMAGLGETPEEISVTLSEMKNAGCDIVTIGQYLMPSKDALPVAEYVYPETFREYEKLGLKLGFKYVFCGPFVRSSYMADKVLL